MATATVVPFVRPEGKGRQPAVIERLRDLTDEITALHAERVATGVEVEALSRRLQVAFWNDRPDIALQVAGRLEALAHSLQRRDAAA